MRRRFLIVCILLLGILSSCKREGRIIPRSKMTKIYVEMFVADQRIARNHDFYRMADTSWVYEPIFGKYGYNSDDYRASVAHYMKDPDRYARILRESVALIDAELKVMKKEKKRLESLEQMRERNDVFIPERIYRMTALENPGVFTEDSLKFYVDSAGGELYFDPREWMDTAYFGPAVRIADTLSVKIDSLSVKTDSLAVKTDFLPVRTDAGKPAGKVRIPEKKELMAGERNIELRPHRHQMKNIENN